jgi:putative hydrolase
MRLEDPLTDRLDTGGQLEKLPGLGPASTRIAMEVIRTGGSPTVERAVDASGRRIDIDRRRGLRSRFLSRAAVLRVLRERDAAGPDPAGYRGDFQMHSEWSDGGMTLGELSDACIARGYRYSAVTDHSYGLAVAGGMSMALAAEQHQAIDRLNRALDGSFWLIKGVEANIRASGELDLAPDEAERFELVLAAPHSKLRLAEDQTERLLIALEQPNVHILAHPRGRMMGSRAGIHADWPRVFSHAAALGVAVEIDGDPSRQDLDYVLAAEALAAGCLLALDSDAHYPDQLRFSETAIAHARLAGLPAERIVNYWDAGALQQWIDTRRQFSRAHSSQRREPMAKTTKRAAGRSGGKVDAPGKQHRGAPTSTRGIKKSDLVVPKLKLAKESRRRRPASA